MCSWELEDSLWREQWLEQLNDHAEVHKSFTRRSLLCNSRWTCWRGAPAPWHRHCHRSRLTPKSFLGSSTLWHEQVRDPPCSWSLAPSRVLQVNRMEDDGSSVHCGKCYIPPKLFVKRVCPLGAATERVAVALQDDASAWPRQPSSITVTKLPGAAETGALPVESQINFQAPDFQAPE